MRIIPSIKKACLVLLAPLLIATSSNAQSCTGPLTTAITGATTNQPLSVSASTSIQDVSCPASTDGFIHFVLAGGSPNYTYSWYDNPSIVSPTRNNLPVGTYTVEGTDSSGCKKTHTVTLIATNTLSTDPTSAIASSNTICNGTSTDLTLVGGSAGTGAIINWYDTACGGNLVGTGNGLTVSPTTTTTYYGRYEGNCNITNCASVTITVIPAQMIALTTGTNPQAACQNAAISNIVYTLSGAATGASVSGLPAGLTGVYNAGSFTISGTPSVAGTFNYTLTSSGNNCTPVSVNGTITVTPISPPPTITFTSPSSANSSITVCAGTAVTMTCPTSNVYEYVWYKNGSPFNYLLTPNNSITVPTNNTGTDIYNVMVTYTGIYCTTPFSNSLTIQKTAPPATITALGPLTYCANSPTTLSANTSANYTYLWKRSTITVGSASTYIPVLSGNHNVTVTDLNTGCSKTSAWINVNINPLPTANAGLDQNVCLGSSIQIGSTSNVANTYTWSPTTGLSNPYISNPMASPSSNTTYTLTVKNASTLCTNLDAVVVNTLALPATPTLSSSTNPVCQGSNIILTPLSSGASSIDWYKNGSMIYTQATNFSPTLTAYTAAAETYNIKSKAANGCYSAFSNSISAWIKEAAIPTINSTPAAVGGVITICVPNGTSGNATLTANTTTASPSYSWKLANAYIPGANSNSYVTNVTLSQNNKVMSVVATYPNGCQKTSLSRIVKLVTTGCTVRDGDTKDNTDELTQIEWESDLLTVYPNPTNGLLNVSIENSEATTGKLILYNTLGQVVVEQNINIQNGKANEALDLRKIAVGVYTLTFETNEVQKVQKVIKE